MQDEPKWLNGLSFFPFHGLVLGTRDFGSELVLMVQRNPGLFPDGAELLEVLDEANVFGAKFFAAQWCWDQLGEQILAWSPKGSKWEFHDSEKGRGLPSMPPELGPLVAEFARFPSAMQALTESVEPATLLRWQTAARSAMGRLVAAGLAKP